MTYDFSDLTIAQQRLLTFGYWSPGCNWPQPGRATVRKLIARGLLEECEVHESVSGGRFQVTIKTYIVPAAVHKVWCSHCAGIKRKREARARRAA